jgi:hypothetical protein
MAYADKMHFSKSEYIEIKKLWLKTRKKQKRELGHEIWMYPFSELEKYSKHEDGSINLDSYEYKYDPSESTLDIDWMNDEATNYTVFNVSTKTKLWLLKNFKLDCIRREVENQLGNFFYQKIPDKLKFNLEDKLDFSKPDTLFSVEKKKGDVSLWFFENLENNTLIIIDKILLYGTTDFYRILDEVDRQIIDYNNFGYTIQFSFCGLNLVNKNGKTYYNKKEIVIPFIKPQFKIFKIKHSYNKKDFDNYRKSQVVISSSKQCVNFDAYIGDKSIKRILSTQIPDYINKQIK